MPIAEAWCAAKLILQVQVEVTWLALVTLLPFHVLLAKTHSRCWVAACLVVAATSYITSAWLATLGSKIEIVVSAFVTLFSCHSRLALTQAVTRTLQTARTDLVAVARDADAIFSLVVVVTAALAVGSRAVGGAVQAVTSVTRLVVQVLVEVAAVGVAVAVAGLALVGIRRRGTCPGSVVIKWQALVAVVPRRVVLAAAHELDLASQPRRSHALGGVAVALASATDGEISDGVEVGLEYPRITEHLVSEGVEAVEHNADGFGRDPVLQLGALLEVVSRRPPLQRGEGDVPPSQRRDVGELGRAEGAGLVLAPHVVRVRDPVGVAAGGAVILIGHPLLVVVGPFEDGEGLGSWRVVEQPYVRDVEGLAEIQREVNLIGELDPLEHGLRLPPRMVVVVVEIRQVLGGVGELGHVGIADLARLLGAVAARLEAVFLRALLAARVGHLHAPVEGCIHELGHAFLCFARLVITSRSSACLRVYWLH